MTRNDVFVVRRAAEKDVDGIERLASLHGSYPWRSCQIINELRQAHAFLFCAEVEECLVGFANMHIVLESAHINDIAVAEEFRRRGVGTGLLNACISAAAARKCVEISLEVRQKSAAARGLYESVGFVPAGVRKGLYDNPRDDAVVMIMDLNKE